MMKKGIQQLAEALDQFAYENEFYEYEDTVVDHELHIQELVIQIIAIHQITAHNYTNETTLNI